MSPYGQSNDPRANKEKWFGHSANSIISNAEEGFKKAHIHRTLADNLNKNAFKYGRLISFSCCYEAYDELETPIRHGYQLPRMWSQYGEKHKGVCLQFSTTKLLESNDEVLKSNNNNTYSKKLHYGNKDYNDSINIDNPERIEKSVPYIFFKKTSWLYFRKGISNCQC